MADLSKTVEIIFEGTDRLSDSITGMSRKLDAFGDQATNVTQPLADMAAAALKLESALVALAVGGLGYAYSESVKFESAVIELEKVIGDEVELLGAAADAATDLSNRYGESAESVLASTANFKQAGFDVQGAMQLTKDALDLVIAGDLEAAEASDLLVASLKGFKAPAEDAARLVDILNEVSNNYATNVRELAVGMAELSPVAEAMGFSMEETAGILTPVIEVFRSGGEAAIALKTGLLRLIDDSKPVQEALASIGVSQRDANGNLRSGRDILLDVSAAFQTLEDDQKLFITQQLVGIQQSARLVTVFDQLNKTTAVTATALNSAGSASAEVAARLASSEVAINRFREGFNNLSRVIGDEFRASTTEAILGGVAIEDALRNMVGAGTFDEVFKAINGFATDLQSTLEAIAKNLPEAFEDVDLSGFLDSVENLGDAVGEAFSAIFDGVDLTTPEGLTDVIQKIVDAITALTNVTAGIVSAWAPFLEAISEAIDKFADADTNTQELTGRILGFGQALNSVFENIGALTGALNVIAGALSILSGTQLVQALGGFKALGASIGAAGASLSGFAQIAGSFGLGYLIGDQLRKLFPVIDTTAQKFFELTDRIFNWSGAMEKSNRDLDAERAALEAVRKRIEDNKKAIDELPTSKKTEFQTVGLEEAQEDFESINKDIAAIPDQKQVAVSAETDTGSFKEAEQIIIDILPDGEVVLIQAAVDQASVDRAKEQIDRVPTEKEVEIELQGNIDKELATIEGRFKLLQSAAKFKAELEIANLEADTKRVQFAFEAIGKTIESTGDLLSESLGLLAGVEDFQTWAVIERQIREESRRRDKALELQEDLTKEQIRYMEARRKRIEQGEGAISIKADGLEPELEAFMWKILEKIQIRAVEEESEFLLGL